MDLVPPPAVAEALDPTGMVDPGLADRVFRLPPGPAVMPAPSTATIRPAPLDGAVPMAGVCDLLGAYAARSLTPTDVVTALQAQIDRSAVGAQAVLRMASGVAEATADSAERWRTGHPRPLEGIPFGIKDIIDVAGTMTTSGSHFTGNRIAPADADAVARLRAAGAIPFAMTATTEFATGSPHNPRLGTVTNPWDASRWTGGSSTGSGAALTARLMPLALGTDTGGSIRVPSCWCGTTGLKPSRERVSRAGVAPLSWTLDHVGPMARSARDIAAVLPHMTAETDPDLNAACQAILSGADIAGLRIGVPINWFSEKLDDGVHANWRAALSTFETLGCRLVALPEIDVEPLHRAGWTVLLSELAALHGERLDRAHLFDPGLLVRLRQGMEISAADYGKALQTRVTAQRAFLAAMAEVDLIVTPGIGGEAGSLETLTVDVNGEAFRFQDIISRNTMIFDFTGFPALMLPSGLGRHGMPTGIQIVGRSLDDGLCLRLGAAFQAATEFHRLTPPGVPA